MKSKKFVNNTKSFLNLSWLVSSKIPNCCFKNFFKCFKEYKSLKSDKVKKLVKTIVAVAGFLAIIIYSSIYLAGHKNDKIIAKVGKQKIYQSEMSNLLQQMLPGADAEVQLAKLPKEMLEILARDIFVQKELEKRAKKAGILRNKTVKKKISDFVKKTAREEYLNSITKDKITENTVRDKYVELVNELTGKKEAHIRYILVASQDQALKLIRELNYGKSFENLARQYSLDENSAKNGGDLGYVVEDNLPKEFSSMKIKAGAISQPIQSEYGWYIVKIEQIRDAHIAPFESVKSALEEQLRREEIKKLYSEITDKIEIKILLETANDKADVKDVSKDDDQKNKK